MKATTAYIDKKGACILETIFWIFYLKLLPFLLGAPKEAPIVTPLMDFVRQRRAAKGGTRVGNWSLFNFNGQSLSFL